MGRAHHRLATLLLAAWLPLVAPPPGAAQSEVVEVNDGWFNSSQLLHTPDWLSLGFTWTAEPFVNPLGGERQLSNWVQQSSLALAVGPGLNKAASQWREIDHWSIQGNINHNAGDPSYASAIGALFPLQQLAYPSGFLLSELSLNRSSGNGWLQLKAGIVPINPPFISAPIFNSYVHSAFNNTLNLSLINRNSLSPTSLPINPYAALGGSVSIQPATALQLRYGWFDLASTSGIARWLGGAPLPPLQGGGNGQILQLEWSPAALGAASNLQACRDGAQLRRLGSRCSRPVQVSNQLPPGLFSLGAISGGDQGEAAYASLTLRSGVPLGLDERLWFGGSWAATADHSLGPSFVGGGWLIQGLLPSRPLDLLVFGAGRSAGLGSGYEGMIELGYQWQVNANLNLQPTLQWILHPSAITPTPPGILAAGLQIAVSF